MKYTFLFIACLFIAISSLSAQDNYVYNFKLDKTSLDLSTKNKERIETKVLQLLSTYGYGANDNQLNNISIVPRLETLETREHQGLETMTFITAEFTLFIRNTVTGIVYSNYHKTLKASASNREATLRNAINKIPIQEEATAAFLAQATKKIEQYYTQECDHIINQAKLYSSQQQYQNAFDLLLTIPRGSNCQKRIMPIAENLYEEFEEGQCEKILTHIQYLLAINDYARIEPLLNKLKEGSICFEDINALLSELDAEIREYDQLKRAWVAQQLSAGNGMNTLDKIVNAFSLLVGLNLTK